MTHSARPEGDARQPCPRHTSAERNSDVKGRPLPQAGRRWRMKLSEAQRKALQSAVDTGNAWSHLQAEHERAGWGGTRNALQRRGLLDNGCQITPAGRAALASPARDFLKQPDNSNG
jgi:hypothetical protein